jgi:hypothetical protein
VEGLVDPVGSMLDDWGALLIAAEDQIEWPFDLGPSAAPDPALAELGGLVAVAEADQQRSLRLRISMPEQQLVTPLKSGREIPGCVVTVEKAFT